MHQTLKDQTPQARLTILLIGIGAAAMAVFAGWHPVSALIPANGSPLLVQCGSALAPDPYLVTYDATVVQGCKQAFGAWGLASVALFAIAGICLIRRLFMGIDQGSNHGYRTSGAVVAREAAAPTAANGVQKRFRKLVVGKVGLSLVEQLDEASQKVEKKLKSAVEEAGYIWNKDDSEYFLFATGEDLSGYDLPEKTRKVLDTHPRGTGCALGVITANKA